MSEALGRILRDTCEGLVGDELFAVTVYTSDGIYHEYLSTPVRERIDEIDLDALRRPAVRIHRLLEFVNQVNPLTGGHEGSVHLYEDVTILHFPAGEDQGVLISIDAESDRIASVFAECQSELSRDPTLG